MQKQFLDSWKQVTTCAAEGQLPQVKDRRFRNEAWQQSPAHLMLAQMYLLSGQAMKRMVHNAAVPEDMKEQLSFSVSQWVDAMSPANFLATNPDAQKLLLETNGQSLQQ